MSCGLFAALALSSPSVLRVADRPIAFNSNPVSNCSTHCGSGYLPGSRRSSYEKDCCVIVANHQAGAPKFGLGDSCNRSASIGIGYSAFCGSSVVDTVSTMGGSSSASRSSAQSDKSSMTPAAEDVAIGGEDFKSIKDSEWRERLTREQFDIARKKGTERPFTGEYWKTKTDGTYLCVCCNTPLFDSKTKFDSGTGWPSYWAPIGENVKSETDRSIPFMPRTEVLCRTCDAHLGHVFDDGPRPTGKRFCINSASLTLKAEDKTKP